MKWYLATNEIDIFHYGVMEEEWEITTGQPNLFFYDTKEELIAALESYGQQYHDSNTIEDTYDITPDIDPILPEE